MSRLFLSTVLFSSLFLLSAREGKAAFGVSAESMYRDFLQDEKQNFKPEDDKKKEEKSRAVLDVTEKPEPKDPEGVRATPYSILEQRRLADEERQRREEKEFRPAAADFSKLGNERDFRNAPVERLELEKWRQIVIAVQKGEAQPFQIAAIETEVDRRNPDAIELLAWMYAGGINVKQDLVKAYGLYRQAEQMKVDHAGENALAVYKSMTREDREKASLLLP